MPRDEPPPPRRKLMTAAEENFQDEPESSPSRTSTSKSSLHTGQQESKSARLKPSLSEDEDNDLAPLVGEALEIEPGVAAAAGDDHHGAGPPGSANTVQMIINIIISFVGAGLLGQPHAFMESGWLLGGVALLTVSALNVYAMLRLPKVQAGLLQQTGHSYGSYSELGRAILGPRGESLVVACLGISQAGFATAYIIFIAANLYSIAQVPRWIVCALCVPGLIGLVQFRDLKSLSPFSLLANLANFCALSAVLFQDYESYTPHNDTIHAVQWGGLLYVVAITIYSMEGVGLVLSLKSSYEKPQKFGFLLSTTLAVISTFMVIFGAAGYWAFGNDTQAPVTLNLASAWSATFVKIALCLGLYLTYPIMMFPIWNIVEASHPRLQTQAKQRFAYRSVAVLASATVAYVMPNFGKFLSLVGSSICTLLGFVFPAFFHLKVCGATLPRWQYALDCLVLGGGLLFGILGTYQSVIAMIAGEDIV